MGEIREVERDIASAIVISSDGKVLMGQKDPKGGGTYSEDDEWHIPGGGLDEGETFLEAAGRELKEETGLEIPPEYFVPVEEIGEGTAKKVYEDGTEEIRHMKFHRFEVRLDKTAEELAQLLATNRELKNLTFFDREQLREVKQIPGGREFFIRQGYMDPIK